MDISKMKYGDKEITLLISIACAKRDIDRSVKELHKTFEDMQNVPMPDSMKEHIDEYFEAGNTYIRASAKFAEALEDLSYDVAYHGEEVFEDGFSVVKEGEGEGEDDE